MASARSATHRATLAAMAEEGEERPSPQQQQHYGEEEPPTTEEESVGAVRIPPTPPQSGYPSVSLNIWPPSQRTREAVINRLVETLSSPSVLSKRYGTVPRDDASAAARLIEEAAFSAASDSAAEDGGRADSIDGGIEILQIYSKEISKRMLESVKARPTPASAPSPVESSDTVEMTPPPAFSASTGEEISSVESEAS